MTSLNGRMGKGPAPVSPILSPKHWWKLSAWLRLGPEGASSKLIFALHLSAFLTLLLLALRDFLFGSGFIIYHNIGWPLYYEGLSPTQAYYSPFIWTGAGPDPAGYTRAWIDAPPIWIGQALRSAVVAQKAFYIYAFLIEYLLSFLAATLFLHWYSSGLVGLRRELIRVGFIALTFINPASLQWEAGGLIPFFWSVPLIEISLLSSFLGIRLSNPGYVVISGVALGIGATLDPRTFVWGWLILAPFYAIALVVRIRPRLECIRQATVNFAAGVPGAVLAFFAYSWNGGSQAPLRSATTALLTWLSSNATPLRLFELQGYFITEITYAPPSIFAYPSIGSLPGVGYPTLAVTPLDPVTVLWLLSLTSLPLLAFSSLLFRTARRCTLPLGIVALGALALASGNQIPVPYFLTIQIWIGTLPVIGAIWQTVIGVPIYVQVVTEAAYIPLAVIAMLEIRRKLSSYSSGVEFRRTVSVGRHLSLTVHLRRRSRGTRRIQIKDLVTFVIAGAIFLASWQFATGAFFPAGYSVGAAPNGVPSIGAAAPATPPAADVQIFRALASDPAQYAVYWPGATGFTYPWSPRSTPSLSLDSPKPVAEPPGVAYLVTHNLTADTAPLFAAAGVRYVILDNMSNLELKREFGSSSFPDIVTFFQSSPGIQPVLSDSLGTWEFEVQPPPQIVTAGGPPLSLDGSLAMAGPMLGALAPAGFAPVLLPDGSPLAKANITFLEGLGGNPGLHPVVVATGANLSASSPALGFTAFQSGMNVQPAKFTSTHPGEQGLPSPYSNWTLSTWSLSGGSVNLSIPAPDGAGLDLNHAGSSATVSLNFLSSLVDGSTRGIRVDPSAQVGFNVSVDVRAGTGTGSAAYLNLVASNASAHNLVQISSPPYSLVSNWTRLNLSGTFPLSTSYFTLRVFATISGEVDLDNVSIHWSELGKAMGTFSGFQVSLPSNQSLGIPLPGIQGPYQVLVDAAGNGSLTARGAGGWQNLGSLGPAYRWNGLPDVALAGKLDLASSGGAEIAGLVLWPTSLPSGVANCSIGTIQTPTATTFKSAGGLELGCVLDIHEPYSAHWAITGDAGAASGTDVFGQTIMIPDRPLGVIAVSLSGTSDLPWILAGFTAYTAASLGVAVFGPVVWRTLQKGVYGLLRHT